MSVLYQLPSEPRIRIEVLVVTEQRVPDAADGATRTFDGGSKTIANSLADETGATLLVAALSDVGGALDSCVPPSGGMFNCRSYEIFQAPTSLVKCTIVRSVPFLSWPILHFTKEVGAWKISY